MVGRAGRQGEEGDRSSNQEQLEQLGCKSWWARFWPAVFSSGSTQNLRRCKEAKGDQKALGRGRERDVKSLVRPPDKMFLSGEAAKLSQRGEEQKVLGSFPTGISR